MAAVSKKSSGAGLAIVQMGLVNTGGIAIADGLPTAGSGGGLQRYRGAISAGGDTPDPERLNVIGDSGLFKHTYQFGSAENPTFNMEAGYMDMVLRAMATGTKVQTLGDWQIGVMGTDKDGSEPQICIAISEYAITDEGAEIWITEIFPLVKLTSKPFPMQSSQATSFQYAGIANQAVRMPWGPALTITDNGVTAAAVIGPVLSENPLTIDTFVGDGATDTHTLQYLPAGDETSNKVKAFLAYDDTDGSYPGTDVTLSDVATDTGVVTFGAAPAENDIVSFLYEVASGELP